MPGEQGLCNCGNRETMETTGPSHLWEGGVEESKYAFRYSAKALQPFLEAGWEGKRPKDKPYWRGAGRLGLPARPVTGSTVDPAVPV